MPSIEEHRNQAHEASRVLIARAYTSDHQVSYILYQRPYCLANTSRLLPVLAVVVLPGPGFETSPFAPNKLPSRRQKMP